MFNILEGVCEVLLVNAHHIKAVPGRKTDVKDCEWIADLLEHGLLRASFIPPPPIRDLRDLTRARRAHVARRAGLAAVPPRGDSPSPLKREPAQPSYAPPAETIPGAFFPRQ